MRRRASLTADVVCLLRAAGGDDPFAEAFLDPAFRAGLRAWRAARRRGLPLDRLTLGMEATVRARHRFIDEALLAALADGVSQLVLLGAGYDARPWRLATAIGRGRVFLVDHPATARARARRGAALPPIAARPVDVDFATEDFGAALRAAGYAVGRPGFFAWEGVSMYLSRDAVRATLDRIRALSAPGSRLAMDLMLPSNARPALPWIERASLAVLRALGEPTEFTLDAAEAAAFLAASGFAVRERVDLPTLAARYRLGPAYPGLYVVHADVHNCA